jgi:hypothetical protein
MEYAGKIKKQESRAKMVLIAEITIPTLKKTFLSAKVMVSA